MIDGVGRSPKPQVTHQPATSSTPATVEHKPAAAKPAPAPAHKADSYEKAAPHTAKPSTSTAIKTQKADKGSFSVTTHKNDYKITNRDLSVNGTNSKSGSVKVGLTGIKGEGSVSVGATASKEASGKVSGKYGTAEGGIKATASAGASANGKFSIGADGIKASGHAEAGVSAKIEAGGKIESKSLGKIGGVDIKASAEVKGSAEVGAKVYADGSATISGHPPTAVVDGKIGGYAGARAGVEGKVGVGPVGAHGKAEAWAGIGGEATLHAGFEKGKLHVDFGIGAALGIGGKLGGGFDLDVGAAGKMAEGVAKDVGHAAESVVKDVGHAASSVVHDVGSAVKKILPPHIF